MRRVTAISLCSTRTYQKLNDVLSVAVNIAALLALFVVAFGFPVEFLLSLPFGQLFIPWVASCFGFWLLRSLL